MFWEKLKGAVKNFFVWVGILVLAGGAVFWQKNRLPEEAVLLDEKIRATTPLLLDQERKEVLAEFDEFVLAGAEKDWGEKPSLINFFFSPGRKLFDQRCARAVREIKESETKEGEIKLWFLYNMGVVLKTGKAVIAFDLGQPWLSDCYGELAETVDLVLTSHAHSDHFDPVFLAQAYRAGATLIFPENCYLKTKLEKENPQAKGKIFNLISGEEREEKGLKIKAFQTDHRGDGNFKLPVAWFWVEAEGLGVLHTGDGREFKNQMEKKWLMQKGRVDLLLGNIMLDPLTVRDLAPEVFVPLHLYEIMHGRGFMKGTGFDDLAKYDGLEGVKTYSLVWGESLEMEN